MSHTGIQHLQDTMRPAVGARRWWWFAGAKLAALAGLLVLINPEFLARVNLLIDQSRFGTLAIFGAVWAVAVVATVVAAFEGRGRVRLFWAAVLATSGAAAWTYYAVSGAEFTIFDAVSLWNARHEAGRALTNFGSILPYSALVFAVIFFVLAAPVDRMLPRRGLLWRVTALVPAIPIAMIAGVVYLKAGNGSQAMPAHFSQTSIGLLLAYKTMMQPPQEHGDPVWASNLDRATDKILILVDESIRPDYLDPSNHSGETPEFARIVSNFVNFGPAVSGGVCSSYANAILRFAASRRDVGGAINSNPTLFRYARKAGYRTVYIDAQAHTLANADLLQNFMTQAERADIDAFYPVTTGAAAGADLELARIVKRELSSQGRVFILANKHGAHFPYDDVYPEAEAKYRPTNTEQGHKTVASNIASYRNAIHWNVDRYFKAQFDGLDLSRLSLVYTSDHGQYLQPGRTPHCVSDNAAAQMALVPLYAYSADPEEMNRLRTGATNSVYRASHFQIAPTALKWMGYPESAVLQHFGESLTSGTAFEPAFTIGDIFGVFSSNVRWLRIDLARNYRDADLEEAGMQPLAALEEAQP